VTAHLDKVEGAVIVFPEEPHEADASEQAKSAVITGKRSDRRVARALRIAGTAVVAATEEPNAFKMPTKEGRHGRDWLHKLCDFPFSLVPSPLLRRARIQPRLYSRLPPANPAGPYVV